MRTATLIFVLLSTAACRTSKLGACSSAADCLPGSTCDTTLSTPVCVLQQGACFPSCDTGKVCRSGQCVNSGCNPACDSAHVCNDATGACAAATTADVTVTMPAANAAVEGAVQATATAHAPGGVSALRFDLMRGGSSIASAGGAAATSDPSHFAATLALGSSIADGPATLIATITYGANTLASASVSLMVDQNPPAITMVTDGQTGPALTAGLSATVTATVTDSGTGVDPATVQLLINGASAIAGTAVTNNTYSFTVPIDNSTTAAGTSGLQRFSITAKDRAGHVTTLSTDPRAVVKFDRDAPLITNITVPDYFDPSTGRAYYRTTPGPLAVMARITDFSGVAGSTVCLRLTGETGATCPHAGTAGPSNVWSFSIPRPSGTQDGTVSTDFTIFADDMLAGSLSGASKAEHQGASVQHIYFDNQPPAVTVTSDTKWYARTQTGGAPDMVTVTAQITDPTGVFNAALLSGTNVVAGTTFDGGFFTFILNALDAPAGVEGPYAFAISANDNFGNVADAGATRNIDEAAPNASLQIFKDAPDGSVVAYPQLVPNTGWTGNSFIYSDRVHVKGTITDVSGIASATLHVDGMDFNGAVTAGSQRPLGCTAGSTSCTFDVQVTLNDLQGGNGVFHTGLFDAGVSNAAVPSGPMLLTIDARDQSTLFDGGPAPHSASTPTAANVTRFLWLADAGPVTGLAIHPNGDLIVVNNAASGNTVFDLNTDDGGIRWGFGSSVGLGPINDQPAIGAGDGTSAAIYVASNAGFIYALSPGGAALWSADAGTTTVFSVGPAVDNAAWTDGGTVEQAVVPASSVAKLWAASSTTANAPFSVTSDNVDSFSSPMVFKGFVWFGTGVQGTSGNISRHPMVGNGTLGAAAIATGATAARPYWGLITDGSSVFAATVRPTQNTRWDMYSISQSLAVTWDNVNAHLSGEPTIDINGKLIASDYANNVSKVEPADGGFTTLTTEGNAGHTPLQGSDGHWYLPRNGGYLTARVGSQLSWFLDPPNTTTMKNAVMDCQGRLFVASGNTVYAFITDDHGLADTPWPALRRDSRNTGNAAAPKYGIRTIAGCTQ